MSRHLSAGRVLSETDATPESFHDCHVQGVRWHRDSFSFSMDMQYILEWIPPADGASGYRFSISEAELTFRSVDELKITMDWTGSAPDAQISSIRVLESRRTPNGASQRLFEIEFNDPDALISLWSTGYELTLLRAPVLSRTQSISSPDGR